MKKPARAGFRSAETCECQSREGFRWTDCASFCACAHRLGMKRARGLLQRLQQGQAERPFAVA